jgi:hypothetical protein
MIILSSTAQTLEIVLSGGGETLHWCVSWIDATSSSATEGSSEGVQTVAGTYTAVAAPASGARRILKSASFTNLDVDTCTVRVLKDVSTSDFVLHGDVTLQPGDALHYEDGQGWYRTPLPTASVTPAAAVLMARHFATANLTSAKTITSASTFAVYLGKAPRSFSTCNLRLRVTTAAATITWAEVAIAKGSINVGGNPTLTVVGWADVATVVNSLGQKTIGINVASGQRVDANDDLWALIGNQATTALQVRAQSIADDLQVGLQASLATRPSLNVGVGQAYTIEGATTLAAWVALVA